jgi:hypothetical protein
MEDGSYSLWNPAEMISTYNKRNSNPTVQNIEEQTSILYAEEAENDAFPIMCAEWNSLKNNFLAFGSTNVLILDIGKDL